MSHCTKILFDTARSCPFLLPIHRMIWRRGPEGAMTSAASASYMTYQSYVHVTQVYHYVVVFFFFAAARKSSSKEKEMSVTKRFPVPRYLYLRLMSFYRGWNVPSQRENTPWGWVLRSYPIKVIQLVNGLTLVLLLDNNSTKRFITIDVNKHFSLIRVWNGHHRGNSVYTNPDSRRSSQ